MIAKIKKRNDFKGIIDYQIDDKKQAKIIDSEGVRIGNTDDTIASFEMQLALSPNVRNPVYHIALNFSKEDHDKLTDEKMVEIMKEYMRKMGISNTQYIAVRHFDKEHPHLHLCINRIDNDGKIISDKYDLVRSGKICKELTKKYNLHFAQGKEEVNRDRLRGADKAKYQIYDSLVVNIPKSRNWKELETRLNKEGIDVIFKYRGKTNDIQGIIFAKNGYYFTGSKIDRSMSYGKISKQMGLEIQSSEMNRLVTDNTTKTINRTNNLLKNTLVGALSILSMNEEENSESIDNKNDQQRKKKGFKR